VTGAADFRALPEGQLPDDVRLGAQRSIYESYFPFKQVQSSKEWAERSEEVRRRVLVSQGLWPLPTRTPLNAKVYGRVDRDDYTVHRVHFESYPGHYVTGSLYRPRGRVGKLPAVLCPHGHWSEGRYYSHGLKKTREEIAVGAERFLAGGQTPIHARCVQLARMGCVVFVYDMVGYADSSQIEHRPGVRDHMNTMKDWGLYSPQAELRLQSSMGLQTWNSIRALDFIASLDQVDASRSAVTGASGGGTQTLILAGVDDRIAVSFPAVMTSTAMQGGCTCENADYLRIDSGNIDIAALAAPRPLGMTGADDWTIELETKGLPDLKNLYKRLGVPDLVHGEVLGHYGHNYNSVSRGIMYNWLNRHFKLGLTEPVLERDYLPLTPDELEVWDDQHPEPSGDNTGDAHERKLVKWMTQDSDKALARLWPKNRKGWAEFERVVGGGWDTILRRDAGDVGTVEFELKDKLDFGAYVQMSGLLTPIDHDEQIPALFLHPSERWNREVVIWLTGQGKGGLLKEGGEPREEVEQLLNHGYSVMSADLFGQGEFLKEGGALERVKMKVTRDAKNPKPYQIAACYTYGYNDPTFVRRVHDILSAVSFVRHDHHGTESIQLVGTDGAGALVLAARTRAGDMVDRTAVDLDGFRFGKINRLDSPDLLPGAVKYGDVEGLVALNAKHRLWLAGGGDKVSRVAKGAIQAAGGEGELAHGRGGAGAAIRWLMK
jgi:dienelactone hydrolase